MDKRKGTMNSVHSQVSNMTKLQEQSKDNNDTIECDEMYESDDKPASKYSPAEESERKNMKDKCTTMFMEELQDSKDY